MRVVAISQFRDHAAATLWAGAILDLERRSLRDGWPLGIPFSKPPFCFARWASKDMCSSPNLLPVPQKRDHPGLGNRPILSHYMGYLGESVGHFKCLQIDAELTRNLIERKYPSNGFILARVRPFNNQCVLASRLL